ncbi:fumarylacetoacetate hydrolase family protein [Novosphingobium pentaromativorans]|uniref:5-carboxymethyl-2-hydroxymuconate Delta-isomerase n=1 Tax=Novosphingobium pentaromativorans US6-1 TaxID=1088721 RepID=G6EGR1_9SPHN|nr:fumarylacetoacetate hydrolase family protein [Novosphingobium pentaromativorans]AIT82087.1 fumarylacetoacetate hydrolase [Novosphingobium pentaromativorans US6-1]EHJ59504.1 5-carboxymethyl-2-hydroxymuconate Delta-isomerase [Novosphingobium pentaromativorans US6-1]
MRLVMFKHAHKEGIAAESNDGELRGFTSDNDGYPGDIDTLVQTSADLQTVGRALLDGERFDREEITFLPVVRRPRKILCVGLNYVDHSLEAGFTPPDYPTIFGRFATTLIGHNQPIVRPPVSIELDYEGEVAAIIGKGGRNIPMDEALSHVAGYSIFNDASIRDYQWKSPQWTMGKNFDATGALGPVMVTADELPAGCAGLKLETRLNGKTVQSASVDEMIFSIAQQIVIMSEVMTLQPGDLIATGTPAGVGMAREPKLWMKAGDVVEVELEGVGVLRNPVIDGA